MAIFTTTSVAFPAFPPSALGPRDLDCDRNGDGRDCHRYDSDRREVAFKVDFRIEY